MVVEEMHHVFSVLDLADTEFKEWPRAGKMICSKITDQEDESQGKIISGLLHLQPCQQYNCNMMKIEEE